MSYHLVEYETNMKIRCASKEDRIAFKEAKAKGNRYMIVGYHGYALKAVVKQEK